MKHGLNILAFDLVFDMPCVAELETAPMLVEACREVLHLLAPQTWEGITKSGLYSRYVGKHTNDKTRLGTSYLVDTALDLLGGSDARLATIFQLH